jgi:RNA polymerase sigma-70 factor (ECF subfamily)
MKMNETKKLELYNNLVDQHYKGLFRYAYKITNNEAVAEDILQETLIRVWNSLESLKELEKAKSWMITILRRENLRRVEKEKVNVTDNYEDFEYLMTNDENMDYDLDKEIVYKNILELKECYREPLALQVMLGYSVEEIADELELNENTVSTRLFRAKTLLEKRMEQSLKTNVQKKMFL